MIECFNSLLTTLTRDSQSNKTGSGRAQGMLKNIAKYKFIATTYFMADVLSPLNKTVLAPTEAKLTLCRSGHQLNECKSVLAITR